MSGKLETKRGNGSKTDNPKTLEWTSRQTSFCVIVTGQTQDDVKCLTAIMKRVYCDPVLKKELIY